MKSTEKEVKHSVYERDYPHEHALLMRLITK